jgi:hypothetical protein
VPVICTSLSVSVHKEGKCSSANTNFQLVEQQTKAMVQIYFPVMAASFEL